MQQPIPIFTFKVIAFDTPDNLQAQLDALSQEGWSWAGTVGPCVVLARISAMAMASIEEPRIADPRAPVLSMVPRGN